MANNINLYPTTAAYNAAKASLPKPNVCVTEDEHKVFYNPYVVVAKVGDILYSDKTYKGTYDLSKTPIAVCVAPASHFSDGKARWMSLCNMSLLDPENGTLATGNDSSTNPGAGIYWGGNGIDIQDLTDYTLASKGLNYSSEAVTEDNPHGLINEVGSNDSSYIAIDYDNGTKDNVYPFTEGYYLTAWSVTPRSVSGLPMPCLFGADGSRNALLSNQSTWVVNDLDGIGNTQKIIAAAVNTETTGAITNSYEEGHYPQAMACHRFHTAGTQAGDWYQPAAGELAYVMTSISKINASLAAIGSTHAIGIGTSTTTGATDTYDTLGYALWSSSEYVSGLAWGLDTLYGGLYNDIRGSGGSDYRVRAFLAL